MQLKHIIETNLIRLSWCCVTHYFHFISLYINNNKIECFGYKCVMCVGDVCVLKHIKEELDWVTDKRLWVISNNVSYTS